MEENKSDHRICRERCDGNVKGVIADGNASTASLILGERLSIESKDLGEETHAGLSKQNAYQTEPKGVGSKRFAKIVRDAYPERKGQRGKDTIEWAGEAEEVSQNDFRFWMSGLQSSNKNAAHKNNE